MDAILLRLIYTVVLLGISAFLVREAWTVWADPQVYVGRFDVVTESDTAQETSDAFAKRIVTAQTILARQISEYQSRGGADAPTDVTFLLGDTEADLLKVPPQALEGIDITIQGVNVRELLSNVRKRFRAPDEVYGHVTVNQGSVLAAVEWPRAPRIPNSTESVSHFLTPSRSTSQEAATYIACAITWGRAAALNPEFGRFPRAQICDFATALNDLYALMPKGSQSGGLSDDEAAVVRRRAGELRTHYGSANVFAELFRLRADLLELLPERARTQTELVEAQEDRLRYAMLNPKLRGMPEEKRRFIALALARPAVVVGVNEPLNAPPNWAPLLGRYEASIRAVATSTGLITNGDNEPIGTGFVAAPGVLVTMSFVVDNAGPGARKGGGTKEPSICFGRNPDDCKSPLTLGKTLFRDDQSGIVLVELHGHDPLQYPPLPLSPQLPEANTLTGRYAFVVGYPFTDQRMPADFMNELLGNGSGTKRVMPGRVLAFGKTSTFPGGSVDTFTTDISTSGGTGGGPFVDLMTGTVLGVSYGGIWRGERGKFAYARPIPAPAFEVISRRLRGDPDEPSSTKGTSTETQ
jgi:S1-C subfamily serine protease